MAAIAPEFARDGQSIAARISTMVVGLVSSYTGRGPTRACTLIDEDLICVVLRDTLSKGERSLVAGDRAQLVLEMRKAHQRTMRFVVEPIAHVDSPTRDRRDPPPAAR
ncbi:MAG: Na-translocating system protein MpsC family protein [Solirubrobacteraceae bacterium]